MTYWTVLPALGELYIDKRFDTLEEAVEYLDRQWGPLFDECAVIDGDFVPDERQEAARQGLRSCAE